VPFVPSAALAVRRAALAGGGFDEALRGGEDVDLVWRLVDAGWDVRYVPSVIVHHDPRASVLGWLGRRAFYGATAGPLARRHPDQLMPASVSVWSAATWGLLAARRPVSAGLSAGLATAVLARRLRGVVRRPVPLAGRIVVRGTVEAAVPTAEGLVRAWGPAVVAALAVRRLRPYALAALVVPALDQGWRRRPPLDPLRYTVAHVADDLAYSAGVWAGCLQAATLRPLVPEIVVRAQEWSRAGVASPPPPSSAR
jgi:mycofactocin system glycosyltransferase